MDEFLKRVPPQNLEAEQSVLGAILLDNSAIAEASELLKTDDFYREAHREIYAAMMELAERREPIDAITLSDELKARNTLEGIGGVGYIAELAAIVPTAANIGWYARRVAEMARLRSLTSVCMDVTSQAFDTPSEVPEFLESSAGRVFEACFQAKDRTAMLGIAEVMRQVIYRFEQAYEGKAVGGLATGWVDLDTMLGGFEPGQYVLIAARPSMGKTAFAVDMARRFALQGQPVAFFSLEMNSEQIGGRMLCCEAGLNFSKTRSGFIPGENFGKLAAAASALSQTQIFIDDSAASTPLSLRNRCRTLSQMLKGKPLGAIFVDYMQLMSPAQRTVSEQEALTQISKALKALAKDFNCPLFALSQLNRDCEKRENKRPILADLRASGALEQDADDILFLYRDEYYLGNKSEQPGVVEVIVAKQRNGPTGATSLTFLKESMRFENYAAPSYQ